MSEHCPCGGTILADTEDWKTPLCDECYCEMGEPAKDPYRVADRLREAEEALGFIAGLTCDCGVPCDCHPWTWIRTKARAYFLKHPRLK